MTTTSVHKAARTVPWLFASPLALKPSITEISLKWTGVTSDGTYILCWPKHIGTDCVTVEFTCSLKLIKKKREKEREKERKREKEREGERKKEREREGIKPDHFGGPAYGSQILIFPDPRPRGLGTLFLGAFFSWNPKTWGCAPLYWNYGNLAFG